MPVCGIKYAKLSTMDNINDIVNRLHELYAIMDRFEQEGGIEEELLAVIAEEEHWYNWLETKYTDFIINGLESQFQ